MIEKIISETEFKTRPYAEITFNTSDLSEEEGSEVKELIEFLENKFQYLQNGYFGILIQEFRMIWVPNDISSMNSKYGSDANKLFKLILEKRMVKLEKENIEDFGYITIIIVKE